MSTIIVFYVNDYSDSLICFSESGTNNPNVISKSFRLNEKNIWKKEILLIKKLELEDNRNLSFNGHIFRQYSHKELLLWEQEINKIPNLKKYKDILIKNINLQNFELSQSEIENKNIDFDNKG